MKNLRSTAKLSETLSSSFFHLSLPSPRTTGRSKQGRAKLRLALIRHAFVFAPRDRRRVSGNRAKLRRAETTWPRVSNFVGRPEPRFRIPKSTRRDTLPPYTRGDDTESKNRIKGFPVFSQIAIYIFSSPQLDKRVLPNRLSIF